MPEGPLETSGTWLRQEGEIRLAPDRPWMPFSAEQWFRGNRLEFRWQARVRMAPLLFARVLDCFEGGRGLLSARVLGFIPVARSRGHPTDVAEAMRGLAELPWRPLAFSVSIAGTAASWALAAKRLFSRRRANTVARKEPMPRSI